MSEIGIVKFTLNICLLRVYSLHLQLLTLVPKYNSHLDLKVESTQYFKVLGVLSVQNLHGGTSASLSVLKYPRWPLR